jgi:hypothetical protein
MANMPISHDAHCRLPDYAGPFMPKPKNHTLWTVAIGIILLWISSRSIFPAADFSAEVEPMQPRGFTERPATQTRSGDAIGCSSYWRCKPAFVYRSN